MSRSLLVLGAFAAASVCGVWVQATRAPVSQSVHAVLPAERIGSPETFAPVVETSHASRQNAKLPAAAPAKARLQADTPERRAEAAATSSTAIPRLGTAMRIAADPVTGQIADPEHSGPVLTVEEMQDLARREAEGLVVIRNADGSETLNHEGRFTDYSLIRIGSDAKPEFVCVQGEAALKRALQPAAPATPKKEDQ